MSRGKPDNTSPNASRAAPSHWSGLSKSARQVAVFVLAVTLFADLVLLALDYGEHGLKGISGGYYLVDFWDVAKAVAIGGLLLTVAQRLESVAIRMLGFVFLILGLEDLITLHGIFGKALNRLTADLVPERVGEIVAFAGFGLLTVYLVWVRNKPTSMTVRRARLMITVLLAAMFFFTAGVDFFAAGGQTAVTRVVALIEESGERFVLTLTMAYAAGLASMRA